MRKVLFLSLVLVLVLVASSALANQFVGTWTARTPDEQWTVTFMADGTFARKVIKQGRIYNEQGRYRVQGQQMYVQAQGEAQGYYLQFRFTDRNTLEVYEDGQLLARLIRRSATPAAPPMSSAGPAPVPPPPSAAPVPPPPSAAPAPAPVAPPAPAVNAPRAAQADPKAQAKQHNQRGKQLYRQRQYQQAIAEFNQAIRLYPGYAVAYHNRGLAYRRSGRYDQAVADYTTVMRLAPHAAIAYYNRAIAYASKGDYQHALADVDRYIKMRPKDPDGPKLRQAIQRRMSGTRD